MNSEFITIEQFNDLLTKWRGKQIKISKVEMDDYNEVFMQLDHITYQTNPDQIDHYESIHTLHLEGEGKILTDTNYYEELPSLIYDIPLQDSSLYEFNGEEFLISTERGTYKITVNR